MGRGPRRKRLPHHDGRVVQGVCVRGRRRSQHSAAGRAGRVRSAADRAARVGSDGHAGQVNQLSRRVYFLVLILFFSHTRTHEKNIVEAILASFAARINIIYIVNM